MRTGVPFTSTIYERYTCHLYFGSWSCGLCSSVCSWPDPRQMQCCSICYSSNPEHSQNKKKRQFPHFLFLDVSWLKKKFKMGAERKQPTSSAKFHTCLIKLLPFQTKVPIQKQVTQILTTRSSSLTSSLSVWHIQAEPTVLMAVCRLTRGRTHLGGMGTLSCPLLSPLILMPVGCEMVVYHFCFTHVLAKP